MTEYYGVIEAKTGVTKIYCCVRETYAYNIKRNVNLSLDDRYYQSVYAAPRRLADIVIQIDFELPPINAMYLTNQTGISFSGVAICRCKILKGRLINKLTDKWVYHAKNNDKKVQLALELSLVDKDRIIII